MDRRLPGKRLVGVVAVALVASGLSTRAMAATSAGQPQGASEPGATLVDDDFSGSKSVFVDNTMGTWTGRHAGGEYVVTIKPTGASADTVSRLATAESAVALQLTMRAPRTPTAEWHGPLCMNADRTAGYAFVVNNGTREWRITELDMQNSKLDEHAVGASSRLHHQGSADEIAIECTTNSGGATDVRGVINGRVVGRHEFTPGISEVGIVGFMAEAPGRKTSTRFVVDDYLLSIPPSRQVDEPPTAASDVDPLRTLLTSVDGFGYLPAHLAIDDETFYSREVFGNPHIDRWVIRDQQTRDQPPVGLLTLASPEGAADDTDSDLDAIVELAWAHNGEVTDTITLGGHPVRRIQKPNLDATVYVWLDRGIYGQLFASDPATAENFLHGFIAAQTAHE